MKGIQRHLSSIAYVGSALVVMLVLFLSRARAQDTSTSSTQESGQPTIHTEVRRGEVVYVSGNSLVDSAEDGQIKDYTIPDESVFPTPRTPPVAHQAAPPAQSPVPSPAPSPTMAVNPLRSTASHVRLIAQVAFLALLLSALSRMIRNGPRPS